MECNPPGARGVDRAHASSSGAGCGCVTLDLDSAAMAAVRAASVLLAACCAALTLAASGEEQQQGDVAVEDAQLKRPMFYRDEEVREGNKTFHPSFGLFPKGCRWRSVTTAGETEMGYQFWDFERHAWQDERPPACVPVTYPPPGPAGWTFNNNTPRTEVVCETSHCVYTNMYYNNGRWYALVDGDLYIPSWRFSRNQEVRVFCLFLGGGAGGNGAGGTVLRRFDPWSR